MEAMKCIQRFNQIILQILSEVIIGAILALFGLEGGRGEGKMLSQNSASTEKLSKNVTFLLLDHAFQPSTASSISYHGNKECPVFNFLISKDELR